MRLLVAAGLVASLLLAAPADACDCAGLPFERAVQLADAVFVAEVVDTSPQAKLAVKRSFKGAPGSLVTIETPRSNCELRFEKKGELYLVFARKASPTTFTAGQCSRTAKAADAADDLAALAKK